ncbi:MAG: NUDIX hydrolase [Bacteroides sp.]|nr:NUDIX hydrolase [Bacteroides sp.]
MTIETTPYSGIPRFHVGVDCIIFTVIGDRLNLLLVRRDFEPEKGKWSLIGGFVNENESVDQAAKRVLYELTGITNGFIRQLGAFGEINRDPGARVISVAYFSLLNYAEINQEEVKSLKGEWVDVDRLPALGFDHPVMIQNAMEQMRKKILSGHLVFNLLPELFTLTQLQNLVEKVMGRPLDKRNFRKRIMENTEIVATEYIDKESSRRGARLYRFIGERQSYK